MVRHKKIRTFFEYLFAFTLIIDCRAMVGYLTNTPSQWKLLKFSLLLISAIGIFLTSNPISKKRFTNSLFFSSCLMAYMLLYAVLQSYDRLSTFVFSANLFLIGFVTFCFYEKEKPKIFLKYRNLIVVIATVSLFFWLSGSVLAILKPSGTVYTTWNGTGTNSFSSIKNYYYMYFETQTTNFAGLTTYVVRNSAIFTEGPMASLNFCIALAINQFMDNKKYQSRRVYKYILCGAIITTFSVTGYIFLIILLLSSYLRAHKQSVLSKILKYILLVVVLCCSVFFIVRLINQKLTVNSGQLRIDDYVSSFKAWQVHPLIGGGFGNDELIYSYMEPWRVQYKLFGLSNSISPLLAEGGIYVTLLYCILYLGGFLKNIKYGSKDFVVFQLLILFLLFSTIFPYQYILIMILIWGVQNGNWHEIST